MPKHPWYPETGRHYDQPPSHKNLANIKHFFHEDYWLKHPSCQGMNDNPYNKSCILGFKWKYVLFQYTMLDSHTEKK